jgi:hypothetical protein
MTGLLHHRPPRAVVFHLGYASDNPPPAGPFPRVIP